MNMFNRVKLWLQIKQLLYRYNLKRKNAKGELKTIQQFLNEMVSVYNRLPLEERIIMRNKIQSIINTYGKE